MDLTKLTENLNNIQSLPDKPALSAEELKQVFDKAPNEIKNYINNTLIEELLTLLRGMDKSISTDSTAIKKVDTTVTEMKKKLDGIEEGANKYTHPTSAGNKHIPSGGSSGKILGWLSDGTAQWVDDKNTTYSNATIASAGLMSALDKIKLDGIANNATKVVIRSGTANPSGGNNGDYYVQYF